jgi:hypothetical protein
MANLLHVTSFDLAALQATGWTYEADFILTPALPATSVVLGAQITTTEALAGPDLVAARAEVNLYSGPATISNMSADLMTLGSYNSGNQVYRLQVYVTGCMMQSLTAGALTVTLFYEDYTA